MFSQSALSVQVCSKMSVRGEQVHKYTSEIFSIFPQEKLISESSGENSSNRIQASTFTHL